MKVISKQQTEAAAAAEDRIDESMLALRPSALWRALRSQHFAFWCICVYLFWEYLKPEQNYPIFRILPFMRIALLGAIFGAFMDPRSRTPRSPFTWLLPLFMVHCIISAALAYNSPHAFEKMDVVVLWVIIFFLITTIVTTERRLYLFVLVYFLANFKMSQFGFFTWVHRGFGFASYGLTGEGWFANSGERPDGSIQRRKRSASWLRVCGEDTIPELCRRKELTRIFTVAEPPPKSHLPPVYISNQ